jgi:hypothetical protein
VVDMLAAMFTGPLFVTALEVWMAARTDPEPASTAPGQVGTAR